MRGIFAIDCAYFFVSKAENDLIDLVVLGMSGMSDFGTVRKTNWRNWTREYEFRINLVSINTNAQHIESMISCHSRTFAFWFYRMFSCWKRIRTGQDCVLDRRIFNLFIFTSSSGRSPESRLPKEKKMYFESSSSSILALKIKTQFWFDWFNKYLISSRTISLCIYFKLVKWTVLGWAVWKRRKKITINTSRNFDNNS